MEIYHTVFQKGIRADLLRIVRNRIKGGASYETLANMLRLVRLNPDPQNRQNLMRAIVYYCLGYRTMRRLIPQEPEQQKVGGFIPERDQYLYHWTEIGNVESIRKNGLVPPRVSDYVYLTDDPAFLEREGFLQWRTKQAQRDMHFALMKIKAHELSRVYEIHRIYMAHEFIVNRVPPQFLGDSESITENPV